MRYANDFVLPAREETVLQGITCRLTTSERYYALELNRDMEKNHGNEDLKGTMPITDHDRSETTGECTTFQVLWQQDNK